MATASATAACQLKIGSSVVGLVQNMSMSMSRATIDVTAVDAAKDTGKAYISAGQYDPGEISFDLIFDANDAQHKLLIDNMEDASTDGTGNTYSFIFASNGNAATATFTAVGYITSLEITSAIDDVVKASCTIKLSGTWTADASGD